MLLEDKVAIVHGASGAIGSAVAHAYAREGAQVHLTGRTAATLERVAERIRGDGGIAHVARLDALDRAAVERHADAVVDTAGAIDICFNATSNDDVQGTPLIDMPVEAFLRPVTKSVSAHFHLATAAGRHMASRRSGVILVMAGGREAIPRLGGAHVAWAALAGLSRQLASELAPHNVRVLWLLSPGSPGSDPNDSPDATTAADHGEPDIGTGGLPLPRRPSYDDVANVAVFAASSWAGTMTATEINFTAGAVVD